MVDEGFVGQEGRKGCCGDVYRRRDRRGGGGGGIDMVLFGGHGYR